MFLMQSIKNCLFHGSGLDAGERFDGNFERQRVLPSLLSVWTRRVSSVGIVDRLLTVPSGLQIPAASRDFLFSQKSWPAVGSNEPPPQWIPAALFPGVKRPRREGDRLPPRSAGVKNGWSCKYIFHIIIHGIYWGSFTFTCYFYLSSFHQHAMVS